MCRYYAWCKVGLASSAVGWPPTLPGLLEQGLSSVYQIFSRFCRGDDVIGGAGVAGNGGDDVGNVGCVFGLTLKSFMVFGVRLHPKEPPTNE